MIEELDRVAESLKHAELMLRGTDAEQKEACATLRKIIDEHQGMPSAEEALRLLERYEGQSPSESRDFELLEFTRRWEEINGLVHVGLLKFLRDLSQKPAVAARLRPAVSKDLRAWITAEVPHINLQTQPEKLAALDRFVSTILELQTYGTDLEELKNLRNALFQVRLSEADRRIRAALEVWSFDDAWAAFQTLSKPPVSFEAEVTSLQDEIYRVNQAHSEVTELLDKTPQGEPSNWMEAAYFVGRIQELLRWLKANNPPPEWRARLDTQNVRCTQAVIDFLKEQAGAARDLDGVRAFWVEYQRLERGNHPDIFVRKAWLENALSRLVKDVGGDILLTDSPEQLDAISQELLAERVGLPDFMVDEITALSGQATLIANTWKEIRRGNDFSETPAYTIALPEAFKKDLLFFRQRLDLIKEAFGKLQDDSSDGELYAEAARVADDILAALPTHALARKLREESERRIAHQKIERAITDWQIVELLDLCRQRPEENECAELLAAEVVLVELEQFVRKEILSGWRMAQEWWRLWRAVCEKLPPPVFALLSRSLEREQEKRADEWYALLDSLLASPLPPEECEAVAVSLKGEMEHLDLRTFENSFLRKAAVGHAERFIKERDWRRAESKIGELDEDDDDARRLRTHLSIAQARETGVVAVSEVLKSDWMHISDYLKKEAYIILLEAAREAWEGGQTDALTNLRMVINRVLTMKELPPDDLEPFAQWEEWFSLEEAVAGGDLAGIKQMVAYLSRRQPDSLLSLRLNKLVARWRGENDVVMLAWSDEAFSPFIKSSFVIHPADELKRRGEETAARVERELSENRALDLQRLDVLRDEMERQEKDWQRLTNYLNELSVLPQTRPQPPVSFRRALAQLETLSDEWRKLLHLQNADLRRDAEREKLDACRRALKGKLQGVAVQPGLLAQLEKLDPLVRLKNFEAHVMAAAARCGDDTNWATPDVFGEVAKSLRKVIALFEQAATKGGALWLQVCEEYVRKVPAAAGSFVPPPSNLQDLASQFDELDAEEKSFIKLLSELWGQRPVLVSGGKFTPEAHLDFLHRLPRDAPRSRRGLIQFHERFARIDSMRAILSQSRVHLPEWICKYLDKGINSNASEA